MSNYKTEVERTESLETQYSQNLERIKSEFKKVKIDVNNYTDIISKFTSFRDEAYFVASGTAQVFGKGVNSSPNNRVDCYLKLNNLDIDPEYIIVDCEKIYIENYFGSANSDDSIPLIGLSKGSYYPIYRADSTVMGRDSKFKIEMDLNKLVFYRYYGRITNDTDEKALTNTANWVAIGKKKKAVE